MKREITVYLAGPIDGCTKEECGDWRDKVTKEVPGINFLNPLRRIFKGYDYVKGQWFTGAEKENAAEIVEMDKEDVRHSDVVFIYYDRPSVGTAMEILYAFEHGIYILVVDASNNPLSPWIYYHVDKVVHSLDEGMECLKKLQAQWILDLNYEKNYEGEEV